MWRNRPDAAVQGGIFARGVLHANIVEGGIGNEIDEEIKTRKCVGRQRTSEIFREKGKVTFGIFIM